MSRQLRIPARATAYLGLLLLAVASSLAGCEEDSKTAPERCADPGLPIFDIQAAGIPGDDNAHLNSDPTKPCVTTVGHSVSSIGNSPTAGTTSGGTTGGKGGSASGGKAGSGGTATADAGAGGAGGAGGAQ